MLRIRLYRQVPTMDGFMAEIELIDVPLDPGLWRKRDDKALERLEGLVRAKGVHDPLTEPR